MTSSKTAMQAASPSRIDSLAHIAEQLGFECIGQTKAHAIEVKPEVRDMCASDRCKAFGRNWMCPPACGDIDLFREKIAAYNECLLVQTVRELEDEFDFETMVEAEHEHKKRFLELARIIHASQSAHADKQPPALLLAAGTCSLCPKCSCPDEPCRHPDQALVSMEAAGILVSDACTAAAIPYNHGKGTIAYTSCVFL